MSDRGANIPLDYLSKRQSFTANSTPRSEFIAAHSSVKLAFNTSLILGDILGSQSCVSQSLCSRDKDEEKYSESAYHDLATSTRIGSPLPVSLRFDNASALEIFSEGQSSSPGH